MNKHGESFRDFEEFLEYLGDELQTLPNRPWNVTITHGRNGSYSIRVACSDEIMSDMSE